MLATFVIGLREGLEAALIVGIIAAFLKSNGAARDLRRMWLGVGAAVALCIAVGVGLQVLTTGLPQREQEMLECVIALIAVAMVTFMILWMRQHARAMRGELESAAASALATGSSFALVAMAFLAVMREGFETAVFLLAAIQNAGSAAGSLLGAALGIAVALVIGWALYRGALRFNMARFFTITGVFLVLVAAGLVMKAFRAAYEAGWLSIGQQQVADLSGLVARGSVSDAVLGGIFGLAPQPVLIEVLSWAAYAVPMLLVVLWPASRLPERRTMRTILATATAALLLVSLAGLLFAPSPSRVAARDGALVTTHSDLLTGSESVDDAGEHRWQVLRADASELVIELDGEALTVPFEQHTDGGDEYVAESAPTAASGPPELTGAQITAIRGRYPVGITAADENTPFPATYTATSRTRLLIDPASHAVLSYENSQTTEATVLAPTGNTITVGALRTDVTALRDRAADDASAAAAAYSGQLRTHEIAGQVIPLVSGLLALVLAGFVVARIRRTHRSSRPEPSVRAGAEPREKEPA